MTAQAPAIQKSASPASSNEENRSIASSLCNGVKRSFRWLKSHPVIPIAIAGILVTGYFAVQYGPEIWGPKPPSLADLENNWELKQKFNEAMSKACLKSSIGYKGLQKGDIAGKPVSFLEHGSDIICQVPLTEEANQKFIGGKIFMFNFESVPCLRSKIPAEFHPYLSMHCRQNLDPDCSEIRFKTYFGYPIR